MTGGVHLVCGGWGEDERARRTFVALAEEVAEGVPVRDGGGLVPLSVDVHAAQWGTLGRMITGVQLGLAADGVAIDEDAAVVVHDGRAEVGGIGGAWWVAPAAAGVHVRRGVSR